MDDLYIRISLEWNSKNWRRILKQSSVLTVGQGGFSTVQQAIKSPVVINAKLGTYMLVSK